MNIVKQNAIAALFHKTEELNHQSTQGWKCIYFKIPDEQERQENAMSHFDPSVVTHMLARMKGFAYLCETGELFILYRGSYNSVISRLSIYLQSLYRDQAKVSARHPMFSLFDLNAQWAGFYRFCETRYLHALSESEVSSIGIRIKTSLPPQLFYNDHVAGYLGSNG